MLCIQYPSDIFNGIVKLLDKKDEENVEFDEFLNAIKTIMLFDNYFEEMEGLFKYLDQKKIGKIKKSELIESIGKLRQTQYGNDVDDKGVVIKCELKVPNEDDLESVMASMILEEEGLLNYDEYLIALFRVTQDGLE